MCVESTTHSSLRIKAHMTSRHKKTCVDSCQPTSALACAHKLHLTQPPLSTPPPSLFDLQQAVGPCVVEPKEEAVDRTRGNVEGVKAHGVEPTDG